MDDPLTVTEIAPPFPSSFVHLQLVNATSEVDVPSIERDPPESIPFTALPSVLLDRSVNVHDVSVTLGDPLNVITDVSINTALPLVSDPKFALVSLSVPSLTANTGELREEGSWNVSEEKETVVEEDEIT